MKIRTGFLFLLKISRVVVILKHLLNCISPPDWDSIFGLQLTKPNPQPYFCLISLSVSSSPVSHLLEGRNCVDSSEYRGTSTPASINHPFLQTITTQFLEVDSMSDGF
jgi:hypothetical protein